MVTEEQHQTRARITKPMALGGQANDDGDQLIKKVRI